MTVKEKKLIQGVAKGMSQTQAAIAAGYSARSARSVASDTLAKPNVRTALERLMDKQGLTETALLQPIKDGLTAQRVLSARVIIKSDDPTVQTETANTRTDDFIETPDHLVRLKASEQGWKLRGKLLQQVQQTVNAPTQINIVHAYRPVPVSAVNGSGESHG